jgi:ABC-type branched-subunit amino acid transport system substrate-binding protein
MGKNYSKAGKSVIRWISVVISALVCISCAATMDSGYYGGERYYPSYPRSGLPPQGRSFHEASEMMGQAERLEKEGNVAEAANLYYRVATSYPGTAVAPEALYRLGQIMSRQEKWHDAAVYYLYLVNAYPQWNGVGQAYYGLAKAFLMERRIREAIDAGKRIPDDGRKNFIFGIATSQDGNIKKAVSYLNNALQHPSMRTSDDAAKAMVFMSKALNEEQLRAIFADRNSSPDLRLFVQASLGKRLMDTGRVAEGKELLKATIDSAGPGHYLASALQNVGGIAAAATAVAPTPAQQPVRPSEPLNVVVGEPGNPKKIGLMVPLSGSASGYGYRVMRGASLAVSVWNEQHPDDPVELVVQDTPPEAQPTVRGFEKLVNEDKVIAVVGPMSRQGLEALEGSGQPIPLLTFALVPDDSSSGRGYGYQSFLVKFLPDVRSIVERIVDYSVNSLGYRTFGIFYPDENFGQQAKEAFLQAVQSRGGQVVAQASYAPGTTNFKDAIKKLVGENKEGRTVTEGAPFQALFLPDDLKTVSLIVPQLAQAGVVGTTFLGSHLWDNPKFSSLSGGYLDGAYYVTPYFSQSTDEVLSRFKSRFQAMYKSMPQFLEASGYDAVMILLQIRYRTEKTRVGLMRAVQQGVSPSESVTGVKKIDSYGVERSYRIIAVKGSECVEVGK